MDGIHWLRYHLRGAQPCAAGGLSPSSQGFAIRRGLLPTTWREPQVVASPAWSAEFNVCSQVSTRKYVHHQISSSSSSSSRKSHGFMEKSMENPMTKAMGEPWVLPTALAASTTSRRFTCRASRHQMLGLNLGIRWGFCGDMGWCGGLYGGYIGLFGNHIVMNMGMKYQDYISDLRWGLVRLHRDWNFWL